MGQGYGELWRQVLGQLAETQQAQAEALGVSQQSVSDRARNRKPPAAVTRWALAMAAAASMESDRSRRRIVARARELMALADQEEAKG